MLPVLGREFVKREQGLAVLLQRLGRLRISGRIDRHETIERGVRVGAGRRHPDRLHGGLRACLLRLGQRIHDVSHFMKPAALATRGRKHLFQRRPEAHCAVADREPWARRQTALFQVEQQFQPRRFRLAITIADRHTLFAPVGFHADDDQQALSIGVLAAQPRVNAVDPPIDVVRPGHVTTAPGHMLVGPLRLQPAHHVGRQALRIIAQQHAQRFAHIARRDTLQIQPGQRCAHARRLPHVRP
jgi:hypothetical protein